MYGWPPITEPELLERLALDDSRFEDFMRALIAEIPPRAFEAELLDRALGYPWTRPAGSFVLSSAGVELLGEMGAAERERVIAHFASDAGRRSPVLAIGSNASPEALERKFAHFPESEDRTVLALTGRLQDFDVGASAQPALYGSMPATLFPSAGTAVGATVLWVTPTQFTQLAWSELSYRLGRLQARFEVDEAADLGFDEVLVFVSRFGAFCVDGRPVALAAVSASGRSAAALTQEQVLDAAAAMAIGPGADAECLVRAIFEDRHQILAKIAATVRKASAPFESDRWTPFSPTRAPSGDPGALAVESPAGPQSRRGAGVVERGGLENRWPS